MHLAASEFTASRKWFLASYLPLLSKSSLQLRLCQQSLRLRCRSVILQFTACCAPSPRLSAFRRELLRAVEADREPGFLSKSPRKAPLFQISDGSTNNLSTSHMQLCSMTAVADATATASATDPQETRPRRRSRGRRGRRGRRGAS